ncbi:hypothetical protein [Streptomyces sp. NPDC059010]|uniref:hypothetical protein n=1 Tax=Streptomyces sp. NPDC059010 TaxID=3346695 RepID=UPI0036A9AA62
MPYVQTGASWVTMVGTVNDQLVMGGVMKLGKALATGVAEEQPQAHDEEVDLAEELRDIEASAPEEVPADR